MKNYILTLAMASLCFAAGWSVHGVTNKTDRSSADKPQPACTLTLGNDLNGSVSIADNLVTVPYPKNGFYGLGVKIIRPNSKNESETLVVGPSDESTADPKWQNVITTLTATVTPKPTDFSLEDYAGGLSQGTWTSGEYQTINGQTFYVGYAHEDAAVWTALTVQRNFLVEIRLFQNPDTENPLSVAAWKNNDRLFRQIIENVRLN